MALPVAIPATALALQAAGLGLSAYGQYQANDTAKQNAQLSLMEYLDWKKRQDEIQVYNKHQTDLANTLSYGNYASGLKKDARSSYGQYNKSIGR